MSSENLATYAESMPISQVLQELRARGIHRTAPDQELRAELARAIFAENGMYLRRESGQGQQTESSPADTVREEGHHQAPGASAMPEPPPAESTRINGDFHPTGAVPRRFGHQSLPGGSVPGQRHPLGTSLPASFKRAYLGNADFNLRRGSSRENWAPIPEEPEAHLEDFRFNLDDLPGRGEGYITEEHYNRLPFVRARRESALPMGPPRAREGLDRAPQFNQPPPFYQAPQFDRAPGFAQPGRPRRVEAEGWPDHEDFDHRPENDSQRQRRLSAAFDSLRKLNIKFSGAPSEDPDEFIRSLREGRQILQITDDELLQCVPFLLAGVARSWYRTTGAHWRSFEEFERAWFGRFTSPDFQYALREEIRARTQHPRERVTDFLTNLRCLMERLEPPLSERDQIREALRNMLPSLTVHLSMALSMNPWATWLDLERLAANVERSMVNAKQYKPPPSADDSMLPSLAYKDSGRSYRPKPVRVNAVQEEETFDEMMLGLDDYVPDEELAHLRYRNSANTTPGGRPGADKLKPEGRCWRCGEVGHFMESCKNPRRVFCRDCGRYGVRRMNCPDCPTIREQVYCTRCGLIGPTTDECKCTNSEN